MSNRLYRIVNIPLYELVLAWKLPWIWLVFLDEQLIQRFKSIKFCHSKSREPGLIQKEIQFLKLYAFGWFMLHWICWLLRKFRVHHLSFEIFSSGVGQSRKRSKSTKRRKKQSSRSSRPIPRRRPRLSSERANTASDARRRRLVSCYRPYFNPVPN